MLTFIIIELMVLVCGIVEKKEFSEILLISLLLVLLLVALSLELNRDSQEVLVPIENQIEYKIIDNEIKLHLITKEGEELYLDKEHVDIEKQDWIESYMEISSTSCKYPKGALLFCFYEEPYMQYKLNLNEGD